MSENEFVFVYAALLREPPSPNPLEIEAVAYLDVESLETQVRDVPVQLAPWLVHYVENHRGAVRQMAEAARTGQLE